MGPTPRFPLLRLMLAVAIAGLGFSVAHVMTVGVDLDELLVMGSLVAITVLIVASHLLHARAARAARVVAEHDKVTGLGNATAAIRYMDTQIANGTPFIAMLFDLDGFKKYNDAYGYACGDFLLHRLGQKLTAATAPLGRVYRMRGDEFCVVVHTDEEAAELVRDAAVAALVEVGEGFMIRCAYGHVAVPREAADVPTALKIADQRVHAQREDPRGAYDEAHSVLAAVVEDRPPELARSGHKVSELTVALGRRYGLGAATLDTLECAAELRDVGNMAIPDAILYSPRKLSDDDWRFIRAHTLVGERLLKSTFGMHDVARVVRSSHERWDGGGYPDGLAGRDIPLGSRIVFACSAFADMTSERPHRPALSTEEALAEMRVSAGTQFDPHVVDMLCQQVGRERPAAPAAPVRDTAEQAA